MAQKINFYISKSLYRFFLKEYGKTDQSKNVLAAIYPELENWDNLPWDGYQEDAVTKLPRYYVSLPTYDVRTMQVVKKCKAKNVDVEVFANVALSKVLGQPAVKDASLTERVALTLDDKTQVIRFRKQTVDSMTAQGVRPYQFIEQAVVDQGFDTFAALADFAKDYNLTVSALVREIVMKKLETVEGKGSGLKYGNLT